MEGRIIHIEDHEEAVKRGIEIGKRMTKLRGFEAETPNDYFLKELHGDQSDC